MDALDIDGAWVFTPRIHGDGRGSFLEWFRGAEFLADLGHGLEVAQANCSVSRRGVIRGIHFADVPPGQAKYITCAAGAILDVAVDLRVGSPGFGRWTAVQLDDQTRRALYIAEGLGHAFVVLSDQATVLYLCSIPYAPAREHGVHPLDPQSASPGPRTWRRSCPTRIGPHPHWRKRDRPGCSRTTAIARPMSRTCVGASQPDEPEATGVADPATPAARFS